LRNKFFQSLIEKQTGFPMGDLVVSLPFEAGSFDALNELFGLVRVVGEKRSSEGVPAGGQREGERFERGMQLARNGGKKKKKFFDFSSEENHPFFTAQTAPLPSLMQGKGMLVVGMRL
jgi:hypothetical protein